jgi:hypothetical protein
MVGRLEGTKQAGLTVAIWDSKDSRSNMLLLLLPFPLLYFAAASL